MTGIRRILHLALMAAVALMMLMVAASCTRLEGWGLVIWSVKGTSVRSGSVVPVYLKSNISKTYLIGLPDAKDSRLEVPFPYLEFFGSRRAAQQRAKEFEPWAPLYLAAGRDGLPVRDAPGVAARRVYRLMLGESVKVLKKVEGEPVFTGGKALAGDWYYVQAIDGTRGYVFSNTMTLYDERTGGAPVKKEESTASTQAQLALLYARPWRPAYFQTMLDMDSVDPDYFSLQYGLFPDPSNQQIRIELPGTSQVFSFSSVETAGDWLMFRGSSLRIRFESDRALVADWGGTDPLLPETGWRVGSMAARFVQLFGSEQGIITQERQRRVAELQSFFTRATTPGSPSRQSLTFISESAGILSIDMRGSYSWSNLEQMPAGSVPEVEENGSAKGSIVFGLHLADALASAWMGGFSLYYNKDQRMDFVYRFEQSSLVIALANPVGLDGMTTSLDARYAPLVFFPMGQ